MSPLYDDLARLSCAPGNYKDGTGEIKSETEVQDFMASYVAKSRGVLVDKFKFELSNPENAAFRQTALRALGLEHSPQCTSQKA
jgi:hypothetical protein